MKVDSISKALFFVTARIVTTAADGSLSGGTGFLYSQAVNGEGMRVLLITNRHVVDGAVHGAVTLIEANENVAPPEPRLGATLDVELSDFGRMWTFPDDPDIDLAVTDFGGVLQQLADTAHNVFFKTISDDLFPTSEQLAELNAIESVTFIGYPSGLYDTKHGTPIARRGWTATPVALDYGGKPMFLVDAPVFGGSSGSPVFVLNEGMYSTPQATVVGSRIYFLGVVTAVHQEHALAEIIASQQPTVVFQRLLNLGLVFRCDIVRELISKRLGEG